MKGLPLLNYSDVCTESPQAGKAFCGEHVAYLAENHPDVSADVRGFLKYCGIQRADTGNSSRIMIATTAIIIMKIMMMIITPTTRTIITGIVTTTV